MKVQGANEPCDDRRMLSGRLRGWLTFLLLLFPVTGSAQSARLVPVEPAARAIFDLLETDPGSPSGATLAVFYRGRGYAPAWYVNNRRDPVVTRVAERLARAAEEGLDPAAYRLPAEVHSEHAPDDVDTLARADLALTGALMAYATDLHDGQTVPREVDRKWRISREALDIADWLETALAQQRVAAAMEELAPVHPVYGALRRALAENRELAARGGWPGFPASGPRRLELGDRDEQVLALRERLGVTDGPSSKSEDPALFDAELEEALKRFQRRHGLNEDGVVGRRTRRALAVTVDSRILQLRAAMERWRWMPRELGPAHVLVNVPAQRLWLFEDGRQTLSMRIIVGKYRRQTPTFSSAISYLVLRPKWYVPKSIAVRDLVPKAQKDPEYYRRSGFTIYDRASGEPVDPDDVDWHAYGYGEEFPFRLVQRAGGGNALGDIKFMFPNPYGVYLHDTSTPSLFLKDERFFSSGCIRVEKPLELASEILSRSALPVDPDGVERMIRASPVNRHLGLERTMPLHVVYMTVWADDTAVYFYHDFYKRDANLLNQLDSLD